MQWEITKGSIALFTIVAAILSLMTASAIYLMIETYRIRQNFPTIFTTFQSNLNFFSLTPIVENQTIQPENANMDPIPNNPIDT
jgi:hypothetical protein